MNEPVMVIQATLLFKSNYNFRVKCVLTTFFYIVSFMLFESNLIFICAHFLTVNKRYFGHCHIKKYTSVFLPWISQSSKRKLGRSFQNTFYKCSKVLNVIFSTQMNFSWTSSYFRVVCPLIAL